MFSALYSEISDKMIFLAVEEFKYVDIFHVLVICSKRFYWEKNHQSVLKINFKGP